MTGRVVVIHKVKGYPRWKTHFEAAVELRIAAGEIDFEVLRETKDPDLVRRRSGSAVPGAEVVVVGEPGDVADLDEQACCAGGLAGVLITQGSASVDQDPQDCEERCVCRYRHILRSPKLARAIGGHSLAATAAETWSRRTLACS